MESLLFGCCKSIEQPKIQYHQYHNSVLKSFISSNPTGLSENITFMSQQSERSFLSEIPSESFLSYTQQMLDRIKSKQDVIICQDQQSFILSRSATTNNIENNENIDFNCRTNFKNEQQKFKACNRKIRKVRKVGGSYACQFFY